MRTRGLRSNANLVVLITATAILFAVPATSFILSITGRKPALQVTMSLSKQSTAKDVVDHFAPNLKGKTAVVTGGNSGIGLETVKALSSAGCRVILCSRDVAAGEKAVEDNIRASEGRMIRGGYCVPNADIKVMRLDLADFGSIEAAASQLDREKSIDYLVLNAGVMCGPKAYTKEGFERQIGTNHFGHFYLTQLLLPKMKAQDTESRIVVVASTAHTFGNMDFDDLHYKQGRKYTEWGAYGQSKLANILFTKGLNERLKGTDVTALTLHPGVIATPLWRDTGSLLRRLFLPFIKDKTVEQGASTTVYACLAPKSDGIRGGMYLADCKEKQPSPAAEDVTNRDKLWTETDKQIQKVLAKRETPAAV